MFTLCPCPSNEINTLIRDVLHVTPTVGHQFDVPSVEDSCLVAGLAAHCDLLGLVEGHLAPHLAGFTSLAVADIAPDAQHLWLWYQRLPHGCLVATPAAGHKISGWSQEKSKQTQKLKVK